MASTDLELRGVVLLTPYGTLYLERTKDSTMPIAHFGRRSASLEVLHSEVFLEGFRGGHLVGLEEVGLDLV